ncbi:Leucine-rich repeat family protein [Prunus dulcis]|uniref:Leucine-rich repeat family protein n=1 Tax=Prunus dulcis TaxID=3755 RepID=A0A4Y1QP77_PRUDU|nr:Leucine-rich repeat family protein [Prunus dulcis]
MYVSRGVGYPALRQAPYVALVVPAYGEIVSYCVEVACGVGYPACRQTPYVALVEILGNVQFIGETLPKFRQKVSVFSKWAWHRGDVRNSKGFVSGFGKIWGGSFHPIPSLGGRVPIEDA